MDVQFAQSPRAKDAFELVKDLQNHFVQALDELPPPSSKTRFVPFSWLRSGGKCGGGTRYVSQDQSLFNRASVNVSQVQYEGDESKPLASASAISSIVHPRNPFAPSFHMHISWTEMKSGTGYWRVMADLNPSIPHEPARMLFDRTLAEEAQEMYQQGRTQGEHYFFIPALRRHRGVAHFYLEDWTRGDFKKDLHFAQNFGKRMISCYAFLVEEALARCPQFSAEDERRQLEYHTLYFLQVLTLDRGTTSGLLVHADNDTGILGSLPSHIDDTLLLSWIERHPPLQQDLLKRFMVVLSEEPHRDGKVLVDDSVKLKLAEVTRVFYQRYPEAQDLLARGHVVPPTVANHLGD